MAETNENVKPAESNDSKKRTKKPVDAKPLKNNQQKQASEKISKDARMWAMFCHLAGLFVLVLPVVGNIVGPLVLWQIKKEQYPFVDDQGKEALNFQISMTIYAFICVLLIAVCIGWFLLVAVGIFDFVFMLIAAVKANDGQSYRYPLTIRFVK